MCPLVGIINASIIMFILTLKLNFKVILNINKKKTKIQNVI